MESINTAPVLEKNTTGDVLWHGTEAVAAPVQIKDPFAGKPVVLRHFFFKSNPVQTHRPTKLDILNQYKKLIEVMLWSDGLIIRDEAPMEVHTLEKAKKISPALYQKMKEEGADFVILVLAEPRGSQTVQDHIHRAQ